MKLCALILLAALAGAAIPAAAKPIHVALKPSVSVAPNSDGFFTLGSVADVTGGETALRTRLAAILVGRAPLSGETRRLTRGDLALKLRQAGCNPDKIAVLEGAETAEVTSEAPPAPTAVDRGGARKESPVGAQFITPSSASVPIPTPPLLGAGGPLLIHRGDAVTIIIQSGPLTIHADGTARENGAEGQTIRVHRDGVMTDLAVQVLDAHAVQLEI